MEAKKTTKKIKVVVDLASINSFDIFYANKATEMARNVLPMVKLFMEMPPIQERNHVIMFLNKELGWNAGKNIVYKKGKIGGSTTQSGDLVTGTCETCNMFKVVFKRTKASKGFVIVPEQTHLTHESMAPNGGDDLCGCYRHIATMVSVQYYYTMLSYYLIVHCSHSVVH